MTRKAGKGGKDGLGPDDRQAWTEYTDDVAPLSPILKDGTLPIEPKPQVLKPRQESPSVVYKPASPVRPAQLDGHIEGRLRKGAMPLDGTLDLHGMTQEQAHARLIAFVAGAHRRGARLLLVITGKSRVEKDGLDDVRGAARGVLNRRLLDWIALAPLDALVLKAMHAAQKHGGSGAYYLYLRRTRG